MNQAVIMAGGTGSRMPDLTRQMPKALLPIANKPMIWYPVNMLQKAGYDQAIVVVTQSQHEAVRKSLIEICQVKIILDFVVIPGEAEDWGTADALRHVSKEKTIKQDVLVISCDTIMDDEPLEKLEELHAMKESAISMILAPVIDSRTLQVPGGKANKKVERDVFAVETVKNKVGSHLVVMEAEADIQDGKSLSKAFLNRYPSFEMYCDRLDAHVYIIRQWVLDLLKKDPSITTIKGELVPKLVRKQHDFSVLDIDTMTKPLNLDDFGQYDDDEDEEDEFFSTIKQQEVGLAISGLPHDQYNGACHAYTLSKDYCLRANNIMMYCEANRTIPRSIVEEDGDVSRFQALHPTVKRGKANIGDSMVGEGTTLGEKAMVKKSTIGRHCIIHDKVKITNSIIMDYCVIEEGCNITGSLIAQQVTLGAKCELKDTIIAGGQKIHTMASYTGEAVVDLNHMMAFE